MSIVGRQLDHAIVRGGRMAQFIHADFGGMSQWSPGMSMVGDMFNKRPSSTRSAATLQRIWTRPGPPAARDLPQTRSATVLVSGSVDWWPPGLGRPGAVGAHNDLRYAVFPDTRRLVIDDRGAISVYDTVDHRFRYRHSFGGHFRPDRRHLSTSQILTACVSRRICIAGCSATATAGITVNARERFDLGSFFL
jgi:hypothetical protein